MSFHSELDFSKENFIPPFFCCPDAGIYEPNDSYKGDMATFGPLFRTNRKCYHFHRHNLHRIRLRADGNVAFYINMFVQKPVQIRNGETKETVLRWDEEWCEFYVPSADAHFEPDGLSMFRDDQIHSCSNLGLKLVHYPSIIEGKFGNSGMSMTIYCEHHGYLFHIIKMCKNTPATTYPPLDFERSIKLGPVRSTLLPIQEYSDEDVLCMASSDKKKRVELKRKSMATETIVEDGWFLVNGTSDSVAGPSNRVDRIPIGVDLYQSPDANGNIVV